MTRTRIKICGVKTLEAALAAAHAGADAVGLVFALKSPRYVEVNQARRIAKALPAFVEPVGLFVDEPVERVREVSEAVGLNTVQLHGMEGPAVVGGLKPLRVIKGIAYEPGHVSERIELWRSSGSPNLHGLLWDTPPPPEAEVPGGTGEAFDWNGLARLRDDGKLDDLPPTILAGGLTPENVAEAVRVVKPYAVDVSSGVEAERGVKDLAKIAAFCCAAREA